MTNEYRGIQAVPSREGVGIGTSPETMIYPGSSTISAEIDESRIFVDTTYGRTPLQDWVRRQEGRQTDTRAQVALLSQDFDGALRQIQGLEEKVLMLRRRMTALTCLLAAILVTASVIVGGVAHASTPTPSYPRSVVVAADALHCKDRTPARVPGEKNSGLACHVGTRQNYVIVRFKEPEFALPFMRFLLADDQYFARRHGLVIIPDGTDTTPPCTKRWARHAVEMLGGGHVYHG